MSVSDVPAKYISKHAGIKAETYLTILGCLSSLRSDISLIAVLGIPSPSASNLMRLSAMIVSVRRSLAL